VATCPLAADPLGDEALDAVQDALDAVVVSLRAALPPPSALDGVAR
jgi:hypothetical protein